jgi:hypothetical protein
MITVGAVHHHQPLIIAALRIFEAGLRRVLTLVGALGGEPPPAAAQTRIMQVRGHDARASARG